MTLSNIPKLDSRLWRFQFSFFILSIGARCNQLAVAWWSLEETHSATVFSYMIACSIGAEVLAKPLLGWVGDRHDKMRIVLACNIVNLSSALALWVLSGYGGFRPAVVGALMVVGSVVIGVRDPIQSSIIPLFASKEQVALAFRSKSILSSLALLIGPGLAGVLVSMGSVGAALAFDVAAAFAASYLVRHILANVVRPQAASGALTMGRLHMILSGFRIAYRVRVEFFLALLAMGVNFALYPFFSILVPVFVKASMAMPAWYVAVLDASFGAGILLGSFLIMGWLDKHLPRDRAIALGFGLLGGNIIVTGMGLTAWLLPAAFILGGAGLMLINVHASTVRTLATPGPYRNRMAATVAFFSSAASPVGSMVIGLLIGANDASLIITGLGALIVALAAAVLCIPCFPRVMRMPDGELDGVYATLYPAAFAGRAETQAICSAVANMGDRRQVGE